MVEISNLHFRYKKKEIFHGLSLNFELGNIYGLLGKNGTGKSTLFRNISGLLRPHIGIIKTFGYLSYERNPNMLSRLFLLPEEFHVPSIKVNEFSKSLTPFYPNFDILLFQKLLDEFQIPTSNRLDQMSLGQRKKSLIAFSIATNTELLMMDEPTNGLDIMSKIQFKKVMASVSNANKCIIISTHQVKDIENLIDRISVIDSGNLLFDQKIETIGKKLLFENSIEKKDSAISEFESIRGYESILQNFTDEEARVDLEILYKGIMDNPKALNKIFH